MRLFVVAWREAPVPLALEAAGRRIGLETAVLTPPEVARQAVRGDLVLSYLDVRPSLEGPEPGVAKLRGLQSRGIVVLNGPEAITACHDKLVTALRLGRAGLPHPETAYLSASSSRRDVSRLRFPVVVKPRFGSRGEHVFLCEEPDSLGALLARLRKLAWFRRHGALIQELVPPAGHDLRILVAGRRVVGAVRRVAPPGEWRTNVSLGAVRRPVQPQPVECELAIAAARAAGADLAGVDLIPRPDGSLAVLEVNGAPEFTAAYSLDGRDVFEAVLIALLLPEPVEAALAPAQSGGH
ncbi:MAG: ATP-grasp domain-containing protein [Gaiellaceae bacterium]